MILIYDHVVKNYGFDLTLRARNQTSFILFRKNVCMYLLQV